MKMNNKGQVLVIVVILLPIVFLFLAYVIDTARFGYEKNRIEEIVSNAKEYSEKDNEITNDGIEEFIRLNDDEVTINVSDEKIVVNKQVNSIFSNIVGKDKYYITVEVER